jgi:hypothetical protein
MMLYVKARMQPESWRSNPDLALALNPDFGTLEFDEGSSTLRPPAAGCLRSGSRPETNSRKKKYLPACLFALYTPDYF